MTFRLLLVDDDDAYWELVQAAFRADSRLNDVSLQRLKDGYDALDLLNRQGPYADRRVHPWPHLVVLDQRMPRMDGTQALACLQLSGVAKSAMICLMTSSEQPGLVAEALTQGARFCFMKPMEFGELIEVFARVVSFFRDVAALPPEPS